MSLQIKEGQVCLGYDLGHGNTSGCIPFSVNDGNWHKVRRHTPPRFPHPLALSPPRPPTRLLFWSAGPFLLSALLS